MLPLRDNAFSILLCIYAKKGFDLVCVVHIKHVYSS